MNFKNIYNKLTGAQPLSERIAMDASGFENPADGIAAEVSTIHGNVHTALNQPTAANVDTVFNSTSKPQGEALAINLEPDTVCDDPFDVNEDKMVTALDALLVINQLNRMHRATNGGTVQVVENIDPRTDTNKDGQTTALDALLIINALNRHNGAYAVEQCFPVAPNTNASVVQTQQILETPAGGGLNAITIGIQNNNPESLNVNALEITTDPTVIEAVWLTAEVDGQQVPVSLETYVYNNSTVVPVGLTVETTMNLEVHYRLRKDVPAGETYTVEANNIIADEGLVQLTGRAITNEIVTSTFTIDQVTIQQTRTDEYITEGQVNTLHETQFTAETDGTVGTLVYNVDGIVMENLSNVELVIDGSAPIAIAPNKYEIKQQYGQIVVELPHGLTAGQHTIELRAHSNQTVQNVTTHLSPLSSFQSPKWAYRVDQIMNGLETIETPTLPEEPTVPVTPEEPTVPEDPTEPESPIIVINVNDVQQINNDPFINENAVNELHTMKLFPTSETPIQIVRYSITNVENLDVLGQFTFTIDGNAVNLSSADLNGNTLTIVLNESLAAGSTPLLALSGFSTEEIRTAHVEVSAINE